MELIKEVAVRTEKDGDHKPELPVSVVRRILREASDLRVSIDAAEWCSRFLCEMATELGKRAAPLATHGKRKTIRTEDLKMAVQLR